jgi:RNA polymerase sigma factor (sigma-70 family)
MPAATPADIARRALADHLAALPAAELLARYVRSRDAEAFAGLVRQFGPLVLGTCRRVLGLSPDADDVFQSVFLALARQAGSFRDSGALPAWLHRVALRTAHRARARRAAVAQPTSDVPEPVDPSDPLANAAWRDVRRVLDEELDALPEKVRGAVVMCWLDGLTQDEAAVRLGFSRNTLKRRLEAGRALLRSRLARRGLAPGLVAAAVLDPTGLRAVLPDAVALLAVEAGLGVPVPPAVETLAVSVSVSAPARGALRVALGLVVVGAATAGVVTLNHARPASEPDAVKAPAVVEPPTPEQPRLDEFGDPLPTRALFRIGTDRFHLPALPTGHALSPDGKRLALADEARTASVRLLDLETGRTLWQSAANTIEGRTSFAFAPDGTRLFVIDREGAILAFDTATGRVVSRFVRGDRPEEDPGYGAVWFPVGATHLSARAGKELRALDPTTGTTVRTIPTPGTPLIVTPDGQRVYAYLGPRILWHGDGVPQGDVVVQLDATGKELHRFTVRAGGVCTADLSPDGSRLVLNSVQGEVRVFDTRTKRELARRGELNVIWGLMTASPPQVENPLFGFHSFAPDGSALLGCDATGLWELEIASRQVRYRCRWSREERLRPGVTNARHVVPRFEPVKGAERWAEPLVIADRVLVCASTEGAITRWDTGTGNKLQGPTGYDRLLATRSADGRVVVAVDATSGAAEVFDGRTGKRLRQLALGADVNNLALSRDGAQLLTTFWSARPRTVDPRAPLVPREPLVWDTTTGRSSRPFAPGSAPSGAFAFNPDWTAFAVLSDPRDDEVLLTEIDNPPKKVKPKAPVPAPIPALSVFDTTTGKRLWGRDENDSRGGLCAPKSVTYAPDGNTLACAWSNGVIVFHDASTGKELARFDAAPKADPGENDPNSFPGERTWVPQFAPGGNMVGWYDNWRDRVRVIQFRGTNPPMELVPRKPGAREDVFRTFVGAFSFGPNGVWMAMADGMDVQLWDVATGTRLDRLIGHRGTVLSAEFAHDGRSVLSVSADRTALVWEVKPPKAAPRPAEQLWTDLAGNPDAAFRAVWDAAAQPDCAKVFRAKLPPASVPTTGPLTAEHWRQKRAVLALELSDTPEARAVLREWAGGAAGAVLTEDAKSSLGRIVAAGK